MTAHDASMTTANGLTEMIVKEFGEPATPTLRRSELLARIYARAADDGIVCELLLLSDAPVRRGALFDATGSRVTFPEGIAYTRCFVALLDPRPLAKWAHDAHWAFVPADGEGKIAVVPTSWPPHGEGPVEFREEQRPP